MAVSATGGCQGESECAGKGQAAQPVKGRFEPMSMHLG
jgi:hypothetical protein